MELRKKTFLLFFVQSSSHDPRDLLSRFELFIETYLREKNQSRFEVIKKSQLEKLRAPFKNLSEEAGYLLHTSLDRDFDFDWKEKVFIFPKFLWQFLKLSLSALKLIAAMEEVTFDEHIESVIQYLGKENPKRLGLLLNGKQEGEISTFSYSTVSSIPELKAAMLKSRL